MVKQEQILEAALRRFSHFGISKTTMTEVAEDLAVTKQVLSYYFPDKTTLIRAVSEKIMDDYYKDLKQQVETASTVEQGLLAVTEQKSRYFQKYYLLIIQVEQLDSGTIKSSGNWRKFVAARELDFISALFKRGVSTGELRQIDPEKTGELFLDTLYAFSRCIKEKGVIPDPAAFMDIYQKQREVIKLFYQGIKSGTCVN